MCRVFFSTDVWCSRGSQSKFGCDERPVSGALTGVQSKGISMKLLNALAFSALGTLALCTASQAATVLFQDDFNSDSYALNGTPTGWKVTSGTVDIIGSGTPYDFLPGNGMYIDMDGSTTHQGRLRTVQTFNFVPGQTYTLSYQLAGSQRDWSPRDRVRASFRDTGGHLVPGTNQVTNLAYTAGFTTFTETFTVAAPVTARLVFSAISRVSDNAGLLLDNVKLTAVPLPGAALLMLSGLAGLGAFARRRRTSAA